MLIPCLDTRWVLHSTSHNMFHSREPLRTRWVAGLAEQRLVFLPSLFASGPFVCNTHGPLCGTPAYLFYVAPAYLFYVAPAYLFVNAAYFCCNTCMGHLRSLLAVASGPQFPQSTVWASLSLDPCTGHLCAAPYSSPTSCWAWLCAISPPI